YTFEHPRPELDPSQIVEVQVLKGERAVAAYGQAGAPGGVIITTPRGAASGEVRVGLVPGGTRPNRRESRAGRKPGGRVAGRGGGGGEERVGLRPGESVGNRGESRAAESPLGRVDGVVVPASALRDSDADDIRDIQVLKGPAVVQQYGDRAADGVVLVRTKD